MNSSDNVDVRPACPFCDGIVRIENIEENVSFNTPEGTVVLPVVVPYEVCDECGFRGFGVAGERARTGAVYDYLGRLKPWQIADIRRGLGLTQTEFADRLGVGHATLERWETGAKVQNRSLDNLIVLLSSQRNFEWLLLERRRLVDAASLNAKIIHLDRFRELSSLDDKARAQVVSRASKFKLRM